MKKLLFTITTFLTLNLSAQNMTPVTRADVNEINLRLDGLEKFGKQHRTGNRLMIAGVIAAGLGTYAYINSTTSPTNQYKTGTGLMIVGSALSTAGLIVNINSFRHLRKNTDR